MRRIATAAAALVLLAGCGSAHTASPTKAKTTSSPTTSTPSPTSTAAANGGYSTYTNQNGATVTYAISKTPPAGWATKWDAIRGQAHGAAVTWVTVSVDNAHGVTSTSSDVEDLQVIDQQGKTHSASEATDLGTDQGWPDSIAESDATNDLFDAAPDATDVHPGAKSAMYLVFNPALTSIKSVWVGDTQIYDHVIPGVNAG